MKQDNNKSHYPWLKSLWRIVVFLLLLPFSLSLWIWHRPWQKNTRIGLIVLLWGIIYAYYHFSSASYAARQAGKKQVLQEFADQANNAPTLPPTTISPESAEQPLIIPTPQKGVQLGDCEVKGNMFKASKSDCEDLKGYWKLTQNPTLAPVLSPEKSLEPQQREIVMGSTPRGITFYRKLENLHEQGKVSGEPYTEYESDWVVDVNPKTQSVQLGLKYYSIDDQVTDLNRLLILSDFQTIKVLAEQEKDLILPEYGTLRLFVLTYHDKTGRARGELQQLMIDPAPTWSDWN